MCSHLREKEKGKLLSLTTDGEQEGERRDVPFLWVHEKILTRIESYSQLSDWDFERPWSVSGSFFPARFSVSLTLLQVTQPHLWDFPHMKGGKSMKGSKKQWGCKMSLFSFLTSLSFLLQCLLHIIRRLLPSPWKECDDDTRKTVVIWMPQGGDLLSVYCVGKWEDLAYDSYDDYKHESKVFTLQIPTIESWS